MQPPPRPPARDKISKQRLGVYNVTFDFLSPYSICKFLLFSPAILRYAKIFTLSGTLFRWLGRGSMFVLSLGQLSQLINVAAPRHVRPKMEALVDVGAGDGEVTLRWSPLFQQLYATEMSNSMKKLLLSKGFRYSRQRKLRIVKDIKQFNKDIDYNQ